MSDQSTFDPIYQTESLAFDDEKLIVCGGCKRKNPPNRLKCLYCGREFEIEVKDAASVKTNLRNLEVWERGVNLIVHERNPDVEPDNEKLASFLSIDSAHVALILNAGTPLPIARVESETGAAILLSGLEQFGLKCKLIKDVDLAADKTPVRLSGIEIDAGQLRLKDFNTGKITETTAEDLILLVSGTITESKVDSLEKRGPRKKARLIDESATATDEAMIDIYVRNDPTGFRVRLAGFDFSCLGEAKGLLAGENLQRLITLLKERAPKAKFVNNYASVRQALGCVWDVESRKDSKGVQHAGFGKAELGAVASTNNLNQFTKYSRLQWHLYEG